jgi:formate/nitrite transporter FocA (FNT family)
MNMMIGQSWTAAWAFNLVGVVFLLWMIIMAYQVYRDDM